jgi:hypothetical protein
MPAIEEKYDQEKIDGLKRYLQREAAKNRKKDFEIVIDGFKIVSRTSDLNEFDEYEREMRNDTSVVHFLIYDGPTTNRNMKYSFYLNESAIPEKPVNGLGSLGDIDSIIKQRLDEKEKEAELVRLREELEQAKEQLDEAEEYHGMLEKEITDLKSKRFKDNSSFGEILNAFVGSMVKKNASKIPGGELLAGFFTPEESKQELPGAAETTKATFSKEDGPDEMTRHRLALITDLQQKLDEQQMVGLFTVIEHLTGKPEDIKTVIGLLNK